MLATVLKVYNDLWDIRDRRLDGYFLADSLTVNIALVCLYVFLVKVVGPWHMKNRDPYNPKLLMQAYNLFQVVFCSYFVIEGGRKAWFNHYSWGKSGKNRPFGSIAFPSEPNPIAHDFLRSFFRRVFSWKSYLM